MARTESLRDLSTTWRNYAKAIRDQRKPGTPAQASMLDVCAAQLEDVLTREVTDHKHYYRDQADGWIRCDCGATP